MAVAEGVDGAVLGVAVDRVAVMGELHAELVRAAGLRPDLQPASGRRGPRAAGSAAAPAGRRRRRPRPPRRGRSPRPCAASLPASRPAASRRPRRRPSRSSRRLPSRNCSASRAAALLVRANSSTPDTGLSSRWTTPRKTLPGLWYFSLRYALTARSSVSSRPSKCVLGTPAGLATARQWLSSYRMSSGGVTMGRVSPVWPIRRR